MTQPKTNTVKVAEFRNQYDHLYRKVSDYHACCTADEVRNWKRVTQILLDEVTALKCARASVYDLGEQAKAIAAVKERITAADQRIEAYTIKETARASIKQPASVSLTLVQSGMIH